MATLNLTAEQLGLLFTQLHHLEVAGLPCNRALEIVARTEQRFKKPLLIMRQQVNAGVLISEAGFKVGVFNATEYALLQAAEASGQLAMVYKQLAKHYTALASRIKRLKSRLMLSALVLTLALFIQPIPDLVSSAISITQYLQLSVGRLLLIAVILFCLLKLPRLFHRLGLDAVWHGLTFNTPMVKAWLIKRQINQFFFVLAMLLESGVVFSEALPKAVASIGNSRLQKKFTEALTLLNSGMTASQILSEVTVIDNTMQRIIATGEQSGKLASTLLHFAEIEAETISLQDDALVEWLARLVYSLIALWMAYSILHSSIISSLPKNL